MAAEHKSYKVANLIDMARIPADRFPAFAAELLEWHKGMHESGMADFIELLNETKQPVPELTLSWCDDGDIGVKEMNISVQIIRDSEDK